VVANKVRNQSDKDFIMASLPGMEFLGFIPYDQAVVEADLGGRSPLEASQQVTDEARKIYHALLSNNNPTK